MPDRRDMHDRQAQFLIAVGDLCQLAATAHLPVEIATQSGVRAVGIPGPPGLAQPGEQVDDTGYASTFRVDNAIIKLADVVECTIRAPRAHVAGPSVSA